MKLSKDFFAEASVKSLFTTGDMAIKDLSPQDANSSGRIIKNMRICGSGLYEYHVSEAPLMGLTIPSDYHGDTFKIFRSPKVLEENKDLYARVPIITGHHVRVNTANAKQLAVGMVGDTIKSEVDPNDGELYLYTTGTIIAGDGIEAYEKYGELSVGYDPIVEWMPGDYKGQHYEAVLTGFNEINHLLICQTARGGHQCMIMDSIDNKVDVNKDGGKAMGIFKKIFGAPSKKIAGDAAVASALLQSIKAGADAKTQVAAVEKLLGDSVDETLKGYFEELSGDEVKSADKETLGKAIDVVDGYIAKLCGDEKSSGDGCHTAEPPAGDEDKSKKSEAKNKKAEDEPGDEDEKEKEEPKKGEKSAGDSIDYDRIINGVVEKLKPKEKADEPQMGDEANTSELSRLDVLLAGDEKSDGVSSDNIAKEIWG